MNKLESKIKRFEIWIVGTSTLFARFGSLWFSSIPKSKEIYSW